VILALRVLKMYTLLVKIVPNKKNCKQFKYLKVHINRDINRNLTL